MQYQLTSNIDNLCPGLLLEKFATHLKFATNSKSAPWKVCYKFKGPAKCLASQTSSLWQTDGKDLHKQEAITKQQAARKN